MTVENPCISGSHNCHTHATCHTISAAAGDFSCVCNNGYSGDGETCTGNFATYSWFIQPQFIQSVYNLHVIVIYPSGKNYSLELMFAKFASAKN